jgi:hypothetical protein
VTVVRATVHLNPVDERGDLIALRGDRQRIGLGKIVVDNPFERDLVEQGVAPVHTQVRAEPWIVLSVV